MLALSSGATRRVKANRVGCPVISEGERTPFGVLQEIRVFNATLLIHERVTLGPALAELHSAKRSDFIMKRSGYPMLPLAAETQRFVMVVGSVEARLH